MRVYLYQANAIIDQKGKTVEQILSVLGAHKVEREEDGTLDFEKVDAVIVNGNQDIATTSYVVAVALAKQKPILFLLKKGSEVPEVIHDFKNDKKIKTLFHLDFYSLDNLNKKIENFIKKAEGDVTEVPSIKFTLRITPSMERYLQWKSQKTGLSKADFLRGEIAKMVKSDQDFHS